MNDLAIQGFIDTSIAVDLVRKYEPARIWLKDQIKLGISNIAWMEVIYGAQNKIARQQSLGVLGLFTLQYINQDDMEWAMRALLTYRLAHSVDVGDCLIASVSHRLQIPLYTHNLKHFAPMLGNLAQHPY